MQHLFASLLLTGFIGTVLSLIFIILRPLTRRVFSARWHYYIWLVVLIVMIFPLRLNLPDRPAKISVITENEIITNNNIENIESQINIESQTQQHITKHSEKSKPATAQNTKNFFVNNTILFPFIWLIGAVFLFIIKTISYLIFIIKIHKHSELIYCPEIKAYTKRKIRTRLSKTICSPLLIGVIQPVLLLPKANISTKELNNILLHEMTHLKRNDILYKWFICLVKCIHWFNPAIYFISRQINIDCEISCDIEATKNMDRESQRNYMETIISLLTHNNEKPIFLTTGMTGNKNTLKKRFLMIRKKIKISKKNAIISGVLAFIILVLTLFSSGILNSVFLKSGKNSMMELNTDKVTTNKFNILFAGLDNNNRADTIMLLKFSENELNCISIPRNTVFENEMISDILSTQNGTEKAIDIIKKTLAVPIHYYAEINLSAVSDIIDHLGGIDFYVPIDMNYDDPYQDLHINLKKGIHTLNGEGVCQLLQFRQYPEGDLTRIQLHHKFLKEFINQKLTKENIDKVPKILKIISDNIRTNFPLKDLKKFSSVKPDNITFESVPGELAVQNQMVVYEPVSDNNDKIKNTALSFGNTALTKNITTKQADGNNIKIKAETSLYNPDITLSYLTLKPNMNLETIEDILKQTGVTIAKDDNIDLSRSYILGKCQSGDNIKAYCDNNGNITFYFNKTENDYLDIIFTDIKSGNVVAEYGVIPDNTKAYSFMGFDKGKEYNIELQEYIKDDINYIVY